jgi:leader peptidase (prepilin peptidase)/N-methyltransferase
MGYGDFKLLAAIGALLGWEMLPQVIMLSAFVGATVGLILIAVKGRDKNTPIPFGPYLSVAAFIALIWGEKINSTYVQFVGL